MTPNNALSILPFYDSLDKQNHRKDYAFSEIFPLFVPDRKLLPFQLIRPHRATQTIYDVRLYRINPSGSETYIGNIGPDMVSAGLTFTAYSAYDVIKFPGVFPIATPTPEGRYYIRINDTYDLFYSEVFTIVRSVDSYLKIVYWNNEDLYFNGGQIDFTDNFKFVVYLPTQLGKPDYEFEEQVEKRDGYDFIEKQVSEKTFKFNFIAPEFLCDAMRIIRMMDYIEISVKNDDYTADTFLITPKWQDGGYLAAVEAEFQCDTVIKKIGGAITPPGDIGDFNDDYNNDFLNS